MILKARLRYCLQYVLLILSTTTTYGQLTILVTEHKTTHLVMPSEIEYADLGDGENYGFEYEENILRVKGQETEHLTNLTVITADKDYYSFILKWEKSPRKVNYFITKFDRVRSIGAFKAIVPEPAVPPSTEKKGKVTLLELERGKEDFEKEERKRQLWNKAKRLENRPLAWHHVGRKFTNIEVKVGSIYHDLDNCFVVYEIKNHSAVPYDISYIELGVKDKKRAKKSAYTETILEEILTTNENKRVLPGRTNRYVAVYNKLAIPNDKLLYLEIVEQGRNLTLDIPFNKLKILTYED